MSVRVNLSDVDGGSFDPVPSGRYPLNIFDGEIRESGENAKHPGSKYIAWDFTIAAGEFEGRHIWDNTVLDHGDCDCDNGDTFMKGLFKLKNLLAASGKYTDEELASEDFELDIEALLGGQVNAQVTIRKSEEYGDSNVIKKYKAFDAAELASSSSLP